MKRKRNEKEMKKIVVNVVGVFVYATFLFLVVKG